MRNSIQTPSFLFIGDPFYTEKYSGSRLKDLVFENKFPKTFVSSMIIEPDKENGIVLIKLCIAPDVKTLSMYEQDKYPIVFNAKEKLLGCDTACFVIETQEKHIQINTMADGFFGNVYRFTYNRKCQGIIAHLYIDSDIFDEQIEREFNYVFSAYENTSV